MTLGELALWANRRTRGAESGILIEDTVNKTSEAKERLPSASETPATKPRSSCTKSIPFFLTLKLKRKAIFVSSTKAARITCSPPTGSFPSTCRMR